MGTKVSCCSEQIKIVKNEIVTKSRFNKRESEIPLTFEISEEIKDKFNKERFLNRIEFSKSCTLITSKSNFAYAYVE